MRLDFHTDKRLMQEANASGSSDRQIQAIDQAIAKAENAAQAKLLQETKDILQAQRAAAGRAATTVSGSGPEAAAGVQKKAGDTSLENAANSQRNAQAETLKALDAMLAMLQQSGNGLLQANQSIEQMKASLSGMIQVVGIIAKHLGAEEFGDSCLDLATKLKPDLVTMDPRARKNIEDFQASIKNALSPQQWDSYVQSGQAAAETAISRGQTSVERAAQDGVRSAGKIEQPNAISVIGDRTGGSAQTVSSAASTSFSKLLKDGVITPDQNKDLREGYSAVATQQGNKNGVIDTAGEKMAFSTTIDQMLHSAASAANAQKAEKVKTALGLAGPALTPGV